MTAVHTSHVLTSGDGVLYISANNYKHATEKGEHRSQWRTKDFIWGEGNYSRSYHMIIDRKVIGLKRGDVCINCTLLSKTTY